MPGTLTVVGTPLGNLGDLSPRAAEALAQAGFPAAQGFQQEKARRAGGVLLDKPQAFGF